MNPDNQPAFPQPELFYEDRFWEQYVGKNLVSDPVIAIVELVANCWDAGARKVEISWPEEIAEPFRIEDDGEGMTREEFYRRWGSFSYDRIRNQGKTVEIAFGDVVTSRRVFGRNGIGRFAAFCFGSEYSVSTAKNGERNRFVVRKGRTQPLEFDLVSTESAADSGTRIEVNVVTGTLLRAETIRTELGRRFLTDPAFQVHVNGVRIAFDDIENKGLEVLEVPVPGIDSTITVKVIDTKRTDPTGRQHGVAWHVLGRLVGDCGWKDPEQRSLIDGRRVEAKRFTFIVDADLLSDAGAVKPDWSGFEEENETYRAINAAVQAAITAKLLEMTKEKRGETTASVRKSFSQEVRQMTPLKRERWNTFVEKVAEDCPSLTEQELKSVSGILANMEVASSQYGLLKKLHDLNPGQIDDLHEILEEWTLDMAKIVLDEIRERMNLIEELRLKTNSKTTLEVQELQPLFRQGLWIFGPEFETIHFTSNEGMTSVIQGLFGRDDIKGSRNRPDFAILPDGTVGLYSYPEFDDEGAETGPAKLVVVELKAPDVPIGDNEKGQCWKYVRELLQKGLLSERTRVQGFVLGRTINQVDREERTELNGRVRILPMDFGTVLQRADSRLLKLREKIKSAPFLQESGIETFLSEGESSNGELPFAESVSLEEIPV
ncbi:MAG: ATP-binding protein [Chthoniobacterales bacterium]